MHSCFQTWSQDVQQFLCVSSGCPSPLPSRFPSVKWDPIQETLLCVWVAATIKHQTVYRAGEGTGVKEGGQRSRAIPEFLQETETEQGGGTFLVEVKWGVERFQKTCKVAKYRVLGSK